MKFRFHCQNISSFYASCFQFLHRLVAKVCSSSTASMLSMLSWQLVNVLEQPQVVRDCLGRSIECKTIDKQKIWSKADILYLAAPMLRFHSCKQDPNSYTQLVSTILCVLQSGLQRSLLLVNAERNAEFDSTVYNACS